MPTCYTADVHSGKTTSLADYMRDCAKAFMWEYRDDLPFSAPLPTESTFRAKQVARVEQDERQALDAIYALEGMSDADCEAAAIAEFNEQIASADRYDAEGEIERARLQAMADQIAAWSAPPALTELRSFMLDQLNVSGLRDKPYKWSRPEGPLSGADWRARRREHLQRNLDRERENLAKQRAALLREREWLSTLSAELTTLSDKADGER